jgi:hypothetical protein
MDVKKLVTSVKDGSLIEDRKQAGLRAMEDRLLNESLSVVADALKFAHLPEDAEGPLPEWVDEVGVEAAERRFRVAKAAQQPAAKAPMGIRLAANLAVGIIKARATEKTGDKTMNIAVIQMPAPQEYPKQLVEAESDD